MTENAPTRPPQTLGADLQKPSVFQKALDWFARRIRRRNGDGSIRETLEELIEEFQASA